MVQRIPHCLRQGGTSGDAFELAGQPGIQCLDQRAAVLLALRAAMLGRRTADAVLDGIKFGDAPQDFPGQRRLGSDMDVVEFAPHVRPAEDKPQRLVCLAGEQTAEPGIAIDLKQTAEALQMRLRMLALAVLAIDIGSSRMARSAPGPVVHRIAPQPSRLGLAAPRIEHRQRGVVSKHLGRGEHGTQYQFVQRRQPPTGAANPMTQCGTVQRDALAGEDLRLAIQRQMIAVFIDQHMREQCLGGHAAIDWPLGSRCLHDRRFAGAAGIARPANDPDQEVGRDVVQHLGLVFADLVQRAAAAGADLGLDIDHLLDPRQFRRQRAAIAFGRLGARRARLGVGLWRVDSGRGRIQRRGLLGHRLFEVLHPLLHARLVELLRTAAEAVALQRGDDQPLAFDLRHRRQQQLLQGRRIVGQVCWNGEHTPTLNRRCESRPLTLS